MGVATSEQFADLLEPGLRTIFTDTYAEKPQMIDQLFSMGKSGGSYEKDSSVGSFGLVPEFTGTLSYDDIYQGLFVIVLVKFGYMLEKLKVFITDEVKRWIIKLMSRKDSFGGLSDFLMVRVGLQ